MMVTEEAFRDVLESWRKSLIGITRASALVKFRTSGRQVLSFDSPKPDEILDALRDGGEFIVRGVKPVVAAESSTDHLELIDANAPDSTSEPDVAVELDDARSVGAAESSAARFEGTLEPSENEIEGGLPDGCTLLHTTAKAQSVPGILRNLKKTAEELYLDRGVSVLHLAFGLLHWEAVDGTELCSPLLLVPVALQARNAYSEPRLVEGEDDEVLNPALKLLLEERGADFTGMPAPEEATFHEIADSFTEILESIGGLGEWRIDNAVYIGKFTFTKEAMYRDLLENEARVLAHPIVRALATTDPTAQTNEFQFDGIDPSQVDKLAPEDDTPLVLDADSSQRAAIAAARDGKSFVMDGPPGTGKSQTIANMIGTLIHDGKTVLFVSEKAAALDVVRNRLENVGLGSFLFDIHSSKSSRRAVAEELARTLENKAVPPKELDALSRATLVEKRQSLNDYAEASNEQREPLNRSFHDVVGRLSQLAELPLAPAPQAGIRGLTEKQLATLLDAARQLSRSWRPAVEGKAFIWRGVLTDRPLDRELDEARRHLERADTAAAPHRELLLRLKLDVPEKYAQLPAVLAHRDGVTDRAVLHQWLTVEDLEPYRSSLSSMIENEHSLQEAEASLAWATGMKHEDFPPLEEIPPLPHETSANGSLDLRTTPGVELDHAARLLGSRAESLAHAAQGLHKASRDLGLPEPSTMADAQKLLRVAHLRDGGTFPDQRWFHPPELARVRQVVDEIERQHQYVLQASATAMQWFTPAVLRLPLRDLEQRFTAVHIGFGARFSSAFKADKRLLETGLKDPSTFKEAVNYLHLAIDWADGEHYMEQLVASRAGALGRFWNGPGTDYRAMRAALTSVEEALAVMPGGVPGPTAAYLSGVGDHSRTRGLLDSAEEVLLDWRRYCESTQQIETDPSLLEKPIQHAAEKLMESASGMEAAATRIRWVSALTGRDHSLQEVDEILAAVGAARAATRTIEDRTPRHRELFGTLIDDPAAVSAGIDHAQGIRDIAGGPLDHETSTLVFEAGTVADLERSTDGWIEARDSLLHYFEHERREELRAELGTLEDGLEMIQAWKSDSTGQQDWSAHKRHRDQLVSFGLDSAIDFCAEQRVPPDQIEPIVEKTVLQAWTEDLLDDETRLRPLSAMDRDAIVETYRDLDLQLVHFTAGRIIRAANARRPVASGIGETGLLKREGSRKKKHRPSRELIGRARGAVQALKPVFMMSPLAVSQYLPADFTFDVVIFDEASQVLPADAINSIYRGRALILAGDDKQLPPTTFFERAVEEDDENDAEEEGTEGVGDYESVLDLAKGSGALPGLGLRWHYRSQHESLIAYSNYKFYEGKLITFPSAIEQGDDVGVSFRKVDGLYQRGGGAANPGEAAAVARRVIRHYMKHPDLSLGVVAFSVAQKDAIEAALLEERRPYPELSKHFEGEDRLGGFFVRSLESVQGDERDVIIFSIGYGPDEAGKIGTSFGVLNRKGGWRRLNVGITRARRAVEVIASMEHTQIPFSTNQNVEYLRRYLEYAAVGMPALGITASMTGLDTESPFEDSVLTTIRKWGYTVEPQVGAAGYRIDLGVKHPDLPGKFALGVECDGYQYHSAPAARDRDRLRDSILTGLGWTMHRIWGTSWYRHRDQEEARLKQVIESAVSGEVETGPRRPKANIEHPEVITEVVDPGELPTWIRPYRAADRIRLPWGADPSDADSIPLMRNALIALVEAEGPVHEKVVHSRLRDWWDVRQIGRLIKRNIEEAVSRSPISYSGDFMYLGDLDVDYVRAPSVETARSVDQVHPQELALAVHLVVRDAGFAEREEVVRQVGRAFGWSRTGDQIAYALGEAIETALAGGLVAEEGNTLVPAAERAV